MLGVMICSYSHACSLTFDAVFSFCCVADIVHIEHAECRNAMAS